MCPLAQRAELAEHNSGTSDFRKKYPVSTYTIAAPPKRALRIKVVRFAFSVISQPHNTDALQPARQSENNWARFPARLEPVGGGLVAFKADHVFYRAWLS